MLEIKEERVDPKEYARRKRVTLRTVYNRIKAGVLPAYQIAPGYPYEIPIQERMKKYENTGK